jgi:hypothetical protein
MAELYGATSWDQAVGRYNYLSAHGGPDKNSENDQANFAAYTTFKSIVQRDPTGAELYSAIAAGPNQASYITAVKTQADQAAAQAKADAADAAAKKVTSSFLSGFTQYASLADQNLSPTDAAAIISLDQSTKANALALTAQSRAVNGPVVGSTDNSMQPTGGAPGNPLLTAAKSPAMIYALVAVAVWFFVIKKR